MSLDENFSNSSICEINEIVTHERKMMNSVNETCNNKAISIDTESSNTDEEGSLGVIASISASDTSDLLVKPPLVSAGREKRSVSPSFADPQSPSSSSSTSQSTSGNDATFEPTIEMMVNDFDDEQTLNEEEALAALESQDPDEEINTLKEESEMPLEELLAKYKACPSHPVIALSETPNRKSKKSSHKKKQKSKQKSELHCTPSSNEKLEEFSDSKNMEIRTEITIEKNNFPDNGKVKNYSDEVMGCTLSPRQSHTLHSTNDEFKESDNNVAENGTVHGEILKVRRSHLLDLYPEGTFDKVVVLNDGITGNNKGIPLETLYGVDGDEEEIEEEGEDDDDEDEDEEYKKKVMIGTSYQATIPVGLSQYGDILPYENEDKLIWEPSQVSEREVEEYLMKIRDIKSNQQGEEDDAIVESNEESLTKENSRVENNTEDLENNSLLANGDKSHVRTVIVTDIENQAVVKDNEQALHLLVQCGYDFKEALRRKRLNALPLNDCMSLWSEEECQKFEEGIQKYGKDFLKIRQNQVRTRTMRELVQFYYLWKKSERRDHNFANADTVDHMDIYLNEDNEYGSNSVLTPVGSPVGTTLACTGIQRNSNTSPKSISIMTTIATAASTINNSSLPAISSSTLEKTSINSLQQQQQQQLQQHKRRTHNNNHTIGEGRSEFSAGILANSTK